jgi:hypothetical protein
MNNEHQMCWFCIFLSDLANPQYMVIKGVPGSTKVDLKLTDGSLDSFGLSADTEIDETFKALAGLLSKGSGAIADISTLKNVQQGA